MPVLICQNAFSSFPYALSAVWETAVRISVVPVSSVRIPAAPAHQGSACYP